MPRIQRLVDVGEGLGFHPLRGVHHQKRAFDGAHRPGDLIGKVDVAGGVDQVQDVGLAVLGRVFDPHRVGLDRDAAFTLDIHTVQHLRLHVARSHRAGHLDEPVGEGGFAVVDMGHDGEIADLGELGHAGDMQGKGQAVKRVTHALRPVLG